MAKFDTKFGECNVVIVDGARYSFDSVLGAPVSEYSHWDTGDFKTFAGSVPNSTITTLPMPEGRMPNYSLQKTLLKCADAFILMIDTCAYPGSAQHWLETLKGHENVPIVCWIERSREEQIIRDYKKQTAKALLRQYKSVNKTEESKREESSTVKKDSQAMYCYARNWPVQDYQTLVNQIKTQLGEDTPIFNFDSIGLPTQYAAEVEGAPKDLTRIRELFDQTVKECVRLQKERGINQKVQETKKKNEKIQPRLGWQSELDDEEELKPKEKPKRSGSLFTNISKLFGFGGSKAVKA